MRSSFSPQVSQNLGVAARVGDSIIAFGDSPTARRRDPLLATLDGQPVTLTAGMRTNLPGGAVLTYDTDRGAVVRWPDGTRLSTGRWTGDNQFVTLAEARWSAVKGVLGDADGDPTDDLTARDGTVLRDPLDFDQMYTQFAAGWRVEGAASFFRSAMPPSAVAPPDVVSLADLPESARTAAEAVCRGRGLRPGAGLEQCILDVALSGDESFADDAAVVANRLRGAVELAAVGGTVENTTAIEVGQRVTGSLDARFAVDVLTVKLRTGDAVRISTFDCPGSGTFAVTLVAPSGRPVARTRGDGCGAVGVTQLRETGQYQLRVFDQGGFTGRYELQVDGDTHDLTCNATEVAPNDDGSGPEVSLPFELDFHGQRYGSLWVNNNGNVTFDGPLSAFTPVPLDTIGRPIVAAWFADVDTRADGSQPVRYGAGTLPADGAMGVPVRDDDADRVAHQRCVGPQPDRQRAGRRVGPEHPEARHPDPVVGHHADREVERTRVDELLLAEQRRCGRRVPTHVARQHPGLVAPGVVPGVPEARDLGGRAVEAATDRDRRGRRARHPQLPGTPAALACSSRFDAQPC